MSEADALRKTYQGLRVKHEQAEDKLAEFRDKLKVLRQELSSKDRQLEVAKRMLQRVSNDKAHAELVSEQSKAHVRKLEARLAGDVPAADTQAKVHKLQAKLAEQSEHMQQMEARMLLAEETNLQLGREVHVLKRALGMKKSMASEALDSQAKVLHQLAATQEESAALAMQLAQGEKAMQGLRDELAAATSRIQQMQQAYDYCEARVGNAQQQVSEALESAASFRQEAQQAHAQLAQQRAAIDQEGAARAQAEQQAARHLSKVQQLTEKLQSVERASRLSIEALRSEVALAVERAESRAAEHRASATVKEANISERCLVLQKGLEAAEAKVQAEREQHAADATSYKQQLDTLKDEVERMKRAEMSHIMETGRLHGQIDTAAEVNRVLQARLEASEHSKTAVAELEQERYQTDRLKFQVEVLRSQMKALVDSHNARESELEAQVKALHHELAVTSSAAAKLQAEVAAGHDQLSANYARSTEADRYVQELQHTVKALTESKGKLQSYMLEQLSVFKCKLHRAESDNRQLRSALALSCPASAQLDFGCGVSEQSSAVSITAGLGLQNRAALIDSRTDDDSDEDLHVEASFQRR